MVENIANYGIGIKKSYTTEDKYGRNCRRIYF